MHVNYYLLKSKLLQIHRPMTLDDEHTDFEAGIC